MSTPDLQKDLHLIGRAAAGDGDAFADLFDRHAGVVLGVLMKVLKRRELAEEVLQESFLQAWDQLDRFKPERSSPRGWLIMIARSRALDRIRSAAARRRREEATGHDPATARASDPVGTERIERVEDHERVRTVLDELPDEQRRSIELAFFEGLTHRQVAERLEQPLGTVKSRILLGMRKMRTLLEAGGTV